MPPFQLPEYEEAAFIAALRLARAEGCINSQEERALLRDYRGRHLTVNITAEGGIEDVLIEKGMVKVEL